MSKKHYIVNCYTCQHNGQETCKGCRTLLVGEDEPYENWQLREDLEQKDNKIADLEEKLAESEERLKAIDNWKENYGYTNYEDVYVLEDLQSRAFQSEDDTTVVNKLLDYLNLSDENEILPTIKQQLAEKEKQYQDAVANRVNIANIRAILKLHKVQDRIDDMKSKYDCDIEYHLGANNELTHLWEYIDELIEEMSDGKDV